MATGPSLTLDLGDASKAFDRAFTALTEAATCQRIFDKDHTVWRPDPAEIANRLGWLDAPATYLAQVEELQAFSDEVRGEGCETVLLLGMGGSSLAPEVFSKIFGSRDRYPKLVILDSTHPETVLERARGLDPKTTLFVVATKSGGTVETLSFFKYCYRRAVAALGRTEAGKRFAAITDPGSKLEAMAAELGFRVTFLNDPNIGGRYSALSLFGLVPAALIGVDLRVLLERTIAAIETERSGEGPASRFGAAMGALAREGRDKLTLLVSDGLPGFGDWVEQLVAESTGKDGVGILPVVAEPPAPAGEYGKDRFFVTLRLPGDDDADPSGAVTATGHPVACFQARDALDLGALFFQFEMATAVASAVLNIQPFDQPNVEAAKVQARAFVKTYTETGVLPPLEAHPPSAEALLRFVQDVEPGGYVALQAYVKPDPATDEALFRLRDLIRKKTGCAVTVGYGPRFLHSTGQLHKGDAGKGRFVQFVDTPDAALPIPDDPTSDHATLSFDVLVQAQALGDGKALTDAGRPLLRLLLTDPAAQSLGALLPA